MTGMTTSDLVGPPLNVDRTSELTGIPQGTLRDNSRPDGTGRFPGFKAGGIWKFPRCFIAQMTWPPDSFLAAVAPLVHAYEARQAAAAAAVTTIPRPAPVPEAVTA